MRRKSLDLNFLKELGQNVCEEALKALEDGAIVVVNDAKSRAPVDTGTLRDSIHHKKLNNGARIRIVADASKIGKNGKKVYYGNLVEFSPKISKPFMYPALDAHRAEIKQKVIDAIREAVHKHAKR